MATFEQHGIEELETLLWQARLKESFPGHNARVDNKDENNNASDKKKSLPQK